MKKNLSPLLQLSNPLLLLKALEAELALRQSHNRLIEYKPYPKQLEFHAAGSTYRERLLMAGNQLGKTVAAAHETAMHLTGRYPAWWTGRKWDKPVVGWAAGVTSEATRDTVQRLLMGRNGQIGTGAIPKGAIKSYSSKRGVADSIDTIIVRHGGGGDVQAGESMVSLKSYDQGREKFQGETLDFVWLDEEPPLDIYTEALTRTNATGGMLMLTFTPLKGMSEVVARFLVDKFAGTSVTTMTINDVGHYTDEQRQAIINSYPAHEQDARIRGIPAMGSGKVFAVVEADIVCKPFQVPEYWPVIAGLDFGWDHPSAAVKCAWDRDADIFYVTNEHRAREQTPVLMAGAVKPWGKWLPWAWPHDGLQHDKGSGDQLAALYKNQGLNMLRDKATHPPKNREPEGSGGNGVEAGITDMLERMQTGRWKVFETCTSWLEEFRMYHRKNGLIVKERDDLISASRYAYMMRRFAKTRPVEQQQRSQGYRPTDRGTGPLG